MEGQVCKKCGEWKELKEFHKVKDCINGRRPICKVCVNKQIQLKKETDPDYRKHINEMAIKNRRKRIEKDPTYKDRENAWGRKSKKKRRSDPELKQLELEQERKRKKERYATDEKYRQHMINLTKMYSQTEIGKRVATKAKRKYKTTEKGKETTYRNGLKRRSFKEKVSFKPHERKVILKRDKYTCQDCGIKVHDRSSGNWNTPDKAHIDHILPISKGGNSEPNNLQTLCRTCNLTKHTKVEYQLPLF